MATPKKQSTTKSPVSSMGLTFESGNPDNYPIAYVDNVWDIAAANSQLALKLGNSGQFDQHTINEDLATAARTNAAAIETLNKTDGSAGSVKKIVDDAIAEVVAEAPAAFDTLKEMSDWIAQHVEDASAMNTAIQGKVDKVNGKGLSENDYTDTEKSKLGNIEAGAQVNIIEHIKVNNSELPIANKTANITLPTAANEYVYICKNYSAGTSTTILAATHGCGTMPVVTCWLDNKIVELDITKNAAGDITISWNGTTTISAQNPLTICVIGMNVTPEEEQQPTPTVPDASEYPYLSFTKTSAGECSVTSGDGLENITDLVIPEEIMLNGEILSVTSIVEFDLDYPLDNIKSIVIPDSVISVGDHAFDSLMEKCTSLTIGSSVQSIGDYAFAYCTDLISVIIPNSVTSIGEYAFDSCYDLVSAIIPDSVISMGAYVFQGNAYDAYIYCEASSQPAGWDNDWNNYGGTEVWGYTPGVPLATDYPYLDFETDEEMPGICAVKAADNFSETSVVIPERVMLADKELSVEYIFGFDNCSSLTSITIPDSVTRIVDEAFRNCSNLTSVNIPDSVESIGDYAFEGCAFTSIFIPDSVTSMDGYVFINVDNLTIYCEASSQPGGWDSEWNHGNATVVWGYTPENESEDEPEPVSPGGGTPIGGGIK